MVFKYHRKSARGETWTEEKMSLALNDINQRKISVRGASKKYGIPYSTLSDHKKSNSPKKKLGRYSKVFSEEEEKKLVDYLKELDKRFYGLTKKDLCQVAYQYAEEKKIHHPFNNNQAGEQWYANFMLRNQDLSLRTPEPTSVARACGFNKIQVEIFFKNLKKVLEKHHITMDNIYNVDETGIQTSAKKPPKVISVRGKKQVGAISSSERGTLITSLFCCSATGNFISPALVFPRKKKNPRYLEGTPPGTLMLVTDNGWINSESFLEWFKFFVASVRPTAEHKCLLILDNHVSHRSLKLLDYATKNNVVILSVPPHSTHKLQPLDVAVYGPFGKYFERALDKWQKAHPAQRVTFFDVGSIFAEAYLNSATPSNAISGFKKTGITNCDITVFTDLDFAPSIVTDINQIDSTETSTNTTSLTTDVAGPSGVPKEKLVQVTDGLKIIQTGIEHKADNIQKINEETFIPKTIIQDDVTPPEKKINLISNILILPRAEYKQNTRKRKSQKSEILTSTPVKEEIAEKENAKLNPLKKQAVTKKINVDDEPRIKKKTINTDEKSTNKNRKNDMKSKEAFIYPKPPKEECPGDDVKCLECEGLFSNSRPREVWIQCNICKNWAHKLCTYYKTGVYFCDQCKDSIIKKKTINTNLAI